MTKESTLTPERLADLRRIAEAAAPGPWEWRMSKDGRILDLITLETGYNEEIITPSHVSAWLQVNRSLKDFIPAFDPATVLELLDALAAARAEAERWRQQYEALRAGVERVVQDLHERAHATARDWQQSGHPYHDGASDAYYEAARMVRLVRRVLGEAGGGDT